MKKMNMAEMRTVDAGATYRQYCKYGCGYSAWSNYSDKWWSSWITKPIAKSIVQKDLTVHYRNCIGRLGLRW